jgi:dihydroorotase
MAMQLNVNKPKGTKMALEKLDGCELPAAADMHVHLRDGAMTELVV